ncbi:MAG: HNH endonuclease [Phormidesmis priestleyi Ana]|uniref:HNH endonuclease n=1 Tax=Phormidesmis priestleyi Ana TaxID=1666911 RepID=A0A0N8KLU8_9CYAN|nr:MAG: HNH endonuclease [Phormidesmis priestleyi Ana]
MSISGNLRQQVISAANARCEYCQTSSRVTGTPLVMEHILPKSLGGSDELSNLAAACFDATSSRVRRPMPETPRAVNLSRCLILVIKSGLITLPGATAAPTL